MNPPPWVLRPLLRPVDRILVAVGSRYRPFVWFMSLAPPRLISTLGRWRAVRAVDHAQRRVPAYRRFLVERKEKGSDIRALRLPTTDKDGYIRRFSMPDRCLDGRLPERGVAIDESSGSTGTPYNWVRSLDERVTSHTFVSHFARYCFGHEAFITINAFSMGAWATGVNMGIALQRNGTVKNTGPDLDKILRTLEFLGPQQRFLVCGYPPFLKHLVDTAAERGFPLGDYTLMALVGGEGMSEGLRDYLSSTFSPVFSGFGATDLEIGIAGESPLSVAIRRAARDDQGLREAVFGPDSRLPMLFQYNPLHHHVEVNEEGELVFTITRLGLLSPRIAYNIHDEGGVATWEEMEDRFRAAGRSLHDLAGQLSGRPLRVPFLWVYGRKDSTVSVMGANIYPEDVEQALYAEPELAARTHSFCLGVVEEAGGAVRPCFSFEVRDEITDTLAGCFQRQITERIRVLNADFREAMVEHRAAVLPTVRLYPLGEGPFSADASKIKQTRVLPAGGR